MRQRRSPRRDADVARNLQNESGVSNVTVNFYLFELDTRNVMSSCERKIGRHISQVLRNAGSALRAETG